MIQQPQPKVWHGWRLLAWFSLFVSLPLLHSCAVNPATGGLDFVTMSEEGEIELGRTEHEKLMEGTPVVDDEKLNEYVNAVGQRIAKTSDRPDIEYHFTILDDQIVNAFALPGGYIYVSRGIMNYINSEEELAAILAHEVGHVTARHTVRQKSGELGRGVGNMVASIFSVLTTGTNVIGDVTNLYSTAAFLGYGREYELEADQFGAKYLHAAGYDPEAMIKVIGFLKDHERFQRLQEKDRGGRPRAYHGVFASHPRNDQRLREVVNAAGNLNSNERVPDIGNYREMTEGLVYGVNYELNIGKKGDPRRYTHANLGFTLLMPEGWTADNQTSAIIFSPDDKQASLKMEVKRLSANIAPDEFIRRELKIPLLKKSEAFTQFGLIGHMGLADTTNESFPERVAVIYQANRVYIFTGSISTQADDVNYDDMFISTIRSFRPVRVANPQNLKSMKIHYVKANERTTFAALARLSPIPRYAEEELRLLNGYYPSGEPKPGEWIKIVQK